MTQDYFQKSRAISDIVFAYRNIQGNHGKLLSYRDFAMQISCLLQKVDKSISHQAIKNWEDRRNLPRPKLMLLIRNLSPVDWRKDFASDRLAILEPDNYPTTTEIADTALERSLTDTDPQKYGYDQTYLQG